MFKDLPWLLMLLKRNHKDRKDFFEVHWRPSYESVLSLLETEGLIRGFSLFEKDVVFKYSIQKKSYFRVFLKHHWGVTDTFEITKVSILPGRGIGRRKLCLLIKKYPGSIFLLSTALGVMSGREALKAGVFGFLCVRFS